MDDDVGNSEPGSSLLFSKKSEDALGVTHNCLLAQAIKQHMRFLPTHLRVGVNRSVDALHRDLFMFRPWNLKSQAQNRGSSTSIGGEVHTKYTEVHRGALWCVASEWTVQCCTSECGQPSFNLWLRER